ADVACADVDRSAAEETARLVEHEGAKAHVIAGDVTDADVCRATVDETVSALGGLDGLVLNVGIAAGRRLAETTAEQWDYTFAVNLRSHFLLCQAALPVMEPGSAIVFIASVAGRSAGRQLPSHDASHARIFGLGRRDPSRRA